MYGVLRVVGLDEGKLGQMLWIESVATVHDKWEDIKPNMIQVLGFEMTR